MHKTNSRSKKNRECLRQLYEAIIPIWWKHLLKTKTTRKVIKPLQSRIITLNEEDPPHRNQEVVPIFATRQRSISKILHQLRQVQNPDKMQK
jgi:hypothetical protein